MGIIIKFTELGINKELDAVLRNNKISEPTTIQELSIPQILKGEDLIGKAQTGTGKTLAFLLPVFEKLDEKNKNTQALVISPTRELAIQIANEAEKLRKYKNVNITTVYGGASIDKQVKKIKKGSQLIIGTPGRLVDLLKRRKLNLFNLETLVLDEADEIMNMGFIDDIKFIIEKTPKERQTLLFSATMPKSIKNISKNSTKNPVRVEVKDTPLTEGQINEVKIRTTDRKKYDDLLNYLNEENPFMAIIFCRTKMRVKNLAEKLKEEGYSVDEIHGDLNQAKREKALSKFRKLKTRYLVATDVAARGLDIDGITHVINYDEPEREADYVHRIGRTGRAKEKGTAVTFIVQKDSDNRKRRDNKNFSRKRKSNKNNDRSKDNRSRDYRSKDNRSNDNRSNEKGKSRSKKNDEGFDKFKKDSHKSKKDHRSFESKSSDNHNKGDKNKNSSSNRKNKKSTRVRDLIK